MVSKKILFLMGPTCIGKSFIVFNLYKDFFINLVNVDSSSIYREMDIGTAKPSKEELSYMNYHLIDILDPIEKYSVGRFYFDSLSIIENSIINNRIPCFVGGTMMYFWVLKNGLYYFDKDKIFIDNFFKLSCSKNTKNRICIYGSKYLDGFNNSCNVFNALVDYNIISIIIVPYCKITLFNRIDSRLKDMFSRGFIDEVNKLYLRDDLNSSMQSIKSIGYRQIWDYFDGKASLLDAKNNIIQATKFLVKRQLTWLKKWNNNSYIFFDNDKNLLKKIKYILSDIRV